MVNNSDARKILKREQNAIERKLRLQQILKDLFGEDFYSLTKYRTDENWFALDNEPLECQFFNKRVKLMIEMIDFHFFCTANEHYKRLCCEKQKILYLSIPYEVETAKLREYILREVRYLKN